MKLVEIVSGLATARVVADTLFATAAAWGKTPVHARSTPVFTVNRVACPYHAEALRIPQRRRWRLRHTSTRSCATPAVSASGPFELMDMIGHDVNFAVTRSGGTPSTTMRASPSLIQQELVDAGFSVAKSSRGFYDYREGAAPLHPRSRWRSTHRTRSLLHGHSAAVHVLADRPSSATSPIPGAKPTTVASPRREAR